MGLALMETGEQMADDLSAALFDLAVHDLPRDFIREVARVLPVVYREAHARSFDDPAWEKPEGHDLCGHMRRALFESKFRKLARVHGLSATSFRNSKQTSYYTLARAGRLVITQSAVQHEWQMARPAGFRAQHAAVNDIFSYPLLPGIADDVPHLYDPGEIYAILFHGPDPTNPREFGFAAIGFPDSDSHRIISRFSLQKIARAQSAGLSPQESIDDHVHPKIKRRRMENRDQ
jgi:hypothetical protein